MSSTSARRLSNDGPRGYHAGLERFGRELAELCDPLWVEHVRGHGRGH